MPQQPEHPVTECNVESFSRGLSIWWEREAKPGLAEIYFVSLVGGAFALAVLMFVHLFFPLGVLLSALLPAGDHTPTSYLAYEHSPEVAIAFTSMGVAPFVALAMLAIWVRHVCSVGKSKE